MSAEAILIKHMARALQKIADISRGDEAAPGEFGVTEATPKAKERLDHVGNIAREALKGVILT